MEALLKKGLIKPLVWNETTGNLLEGHQRLAILDALEKDDDWTMTVSVVHLSEKDEREANVAMNNTTAMGYYDADLLKNLLEEGASATAMGFDKMDLEVVYSDSDFVSGLFADDRAPAPVKAAVEQLSEIDKLRRNKEARERRNKYEKNRDVGDDRDPEFFAVVVFENRAQREAFMHHVGVEPTMRYVDGYRVASHLGLELPKASDSSA